LAQAQLLGTGVRRTSGHALGIAFLFCFGYKRQR
jgi:hypothetical protein